MLPEDSGGRVIFGGDKEVVVSGCSSWLCDTELMRGANVRSFER